MRHKLPTLVLLFTLLCTACVMETIPIKQEVDSTGGSYAGGDSDKPFARKMQAENALSEFYNNLNQAEYDQAVELYGGSYDILRGYNPALDPDDRAGLLQAACKFNGFMCLEVRNILSSQKNEPDQFFFEVEFANSDGSVFVMGPCCGADEEMTPPQSSFMVQVLCPKDDPCRVMDLPPYVP